MDQPTSTLKIRLPNLVLECERVPAVALKPGLDPLDRRCIQKLFGCTCHPSVLRRRLGAHASRVQKRVQDSVTTTSEAICTRDACRSQPPIVPLQAGSDRAEA